MIFNSMGRTIKTLLKESKETLIKVGSDIIVNNYVIAENSGGGYYTIKIPKNSNISEVDGSEIFYIVEDSEGNMIKKDITDILSGKQINALRNEVIRETENFLSSDSDSEVIDYISDVFDKNGFKPRHIINYDDITDGYELDVIIIIDGGLESFYVSVDNDGNISIINTDGENTGMGNMEDYREVSKNFKEFLDGVENSDFTGI